MRVLNISCPGCTATMLIDRENKRAYCEYCGTVMLIEEELEKEEKSAQEKAEWEERMRIAREAMKKELDSEEDRIRAESYEKYDSKSDKIAIVVFVVIFGLIQFVFYSPIIMALFS